MFIFASELVSTWMQEMGEGLFISINVCVQVPGVNSWACKYVDAYLCVSFQKAFPSGPHLGVPLGPETISFNASRGLAELCIPLQTFILTRPLSLCTQEGEALNLSTLGRCLQHPSSSPILVRLPQDSF